MRTEVPVCTRCCFCIPLRYGLITWTYAKLAANIFTFIAMAYELYESLLNYLTFDIDAFKTIAIWSGITLFVAACDIPFNIVLLIGGHRKNVRLLRITYMYSLIVWILTVIFLIVIFGLLLHSLTLNYMHLQIYLIQVVFLVVSIFVDAYFLLLLRSEIRKLTNNCEFRFENHAIDAQCELRLLEELNVTVTII